MNYLDGDVIILFTIISVGMLGGWRRRHLLLLTVLFYWVITQGIWMQ
jgi:hypothetical protein